MMCTEAMEVQYMKRQWFEGFQLRCSLLLLLILSMAIGSASQLAFWTEDLDTLQTLWAEWNTSTPHAKLQGWSSSQIFPCRRKGTWRGVTCTVSSLNGTGVAYVTALTISDAGIVGTLPDVFGSRNLSSTNFLTLTGNPKLTGPLPVSLNATWLNTVDLHDNGFNGTIPNIVFSYYLENLDLSGNNLTGKFPMEQLKDASSLLYLSIANNNFSGIIPEGINTIGRLQKCNISHNHFNGTFPDLNSSLSQLDISSNDFEGPLPSFRNATDLEYLYLRHNRFSGSMSNFLDHFNVSRVKTLDVSHNNLTGSIPPNFSVSTLGSLQELYLDNNEISGSINITSIFEMHNVWYMNQTVSLKILSLKSNQITDVTYTATDIDDANPKIMLQNNPYCNMPLNDYDDARRCFCTQICSISPLSERDQKILIISISISIAMILIMVAVVGFIFHRNRKYKKYLQLEFQEKLKECDVKPTFFSYNELKVATRDFHIENKLGEGGYGVVYKGTLPNGSVVAVKQLFVKTKQNIDEFSNEIVLISGMRHKNLVNLKGCCLRENSRVLVYEYVDHYDVEKILLGPSKQEVAWASRLKICLGVAHGLHYLHALASPRVIHRDIKASNILLDHNFEPKIADFGLVLLFPNEDTHIMTIHVAGTKGYLAPEYATMGQLSDKVDVYSYGVLCLEIMSSRKNIDETLPPNQAYLTQWAWKLHETNKLSELIDPTLRLNEEELLDALRIIKIALLCIQTSSANRPTMQQVVHLLQGNTQSEIVVLGRSEVDEQKKLHLEEAMVSPLTTEIEVLSHDFTCSFDELELGDFKVRQ